MKCDLDINRTGRKAFNIEVKGREFSIIHSTSKYTGRLFSFVKCKGQWHSLNHHFTTIDERDVLQFFGNSDDKYIDLLTLTQIMSRDTGDMKLDTIIHGWKKIESGIDEDFQNLLDDVFNTFYASACQHRGVLLTHSSESYESCKDALRRLGADDKINRLEEKEMEWLAESLE